MLELSALGYLLLAQLLAVVLRAEAAAVIELRRASSEVLIKRRLLSLAHSSLREVVLSQRRLTAPVSRLVRNVQLVVVAHFVSSLVCLHVAGRLVHDVPRLLLRLLNNGSHRFHPRITAAALAKLTERHHVPFVAAA